MSRSTYSRPHDFELRTAWIGREDAGAKVDLAAITTFLSDTNAYFTVKSNMFGRNAYNFKSKSNTLVINHTASGHGHNTSHSK